MTDQSLERRNNILLITTDQERYFSSDPAPLPARDRLRRLGTTFERYYGASVACSPARSALFTGQHVPNTGVIDNVNLPTQTDLATNIPTVGHRLRDLGYYTAYKGKWHLSLSALATERSTNLADALEPYGFSDFSVHGDSSTAPFEGYEMDDLIAAEAIHWLKTDGARLRREGKPWFLAVNFINPHDIMFAPFDTRFAENSSIAMMGKPFGGPPVSARYRHSWNPTLEPSCFDPVDDPARPAVHMGLALLTDDSAAPDEQRLRSFRDYYVNCLCDVDAAMDRLLDGMDQLGMFADTALVFTADHGELAGAHGLVGKGPCAYDENLRLPLIVIDPLVAGGTRRETIASQVDVAPTILGLAGERSGSRAQSGLPGRDLTTALHDPATPDHRSVALFACNQLASVDGPWLRDMISGLRKGAVPSRDRDWHQRGFVRTLITEQHKFSRYFSPADTRQPATFEELVERNTLELFDLDADAEERSNLAFEPTREARELIEALNAELRAIIENEIGDDDASSLPNVANAPWTTSDVSAT